eukprot:scaffold17629_cov34-Tisochrysis_lutea.AAC.4
MGGRAPRDRGSGEARGPMTHDPATLLRILGADEYERRGEIHSNSLWARSSMKAKVGLRSKTKARRRRL